jgi:RHS repeat-associated protein
VIDAWGNLTNMNPISGKALGQNFQAGPASVQNQLNGFCNDAAGNLVLNTACPQPPFTPSYYYDAENRLVWTSGYRYIYDGNGERVEKCQAASPTTACLTSGTTGTIYWRGTGSDTLAETDLGGIQQEEYIFFSGQRIARRDISSTGGTAGLHYYFSDHLGTHGVVENATGTTCEQDIDYYPFGGVENDYCSSTSVPQNYKFTGKERDTESGLDSFGARYDASSLGRFMTPDWASSPEDVPYANFENPQSLNLYAYALNHPLQLVDTDGHDLVVAAALQSTVTQLRKESTSFDAELAAHEGPNSPNLTFTTGMTPNDPDGSPTTGNTVVELTGGPVQDCPTAECVTVDRPYNYKGATVTINDSVTGDKSQTEDVLKHETGHVHDSRTNTTQKHKDSENTQRSKGKTPGCTQNCHDKRPEEQRANQFKDQVNEEKKQWEKQHCHGFFHKTCDQ